MSDIVSLSSVSNVLRPQVQVEHARATSESNSAGRIGLRRGLDKRTKIPLRCPPPRLWCSKP